MFAGGTQVSPFDRRRQSTAQPIGRPAGDGGCLPKRPADSAGEGVCGECSERGQSEAARARQGLAACRKGKDAVAVEWRVNRTDGAGKPIRGHDGKAGQLGFRQESIGRDHRNGGALPRRGLITLRLASGKNGMPGLVRRPAVILAAKFAFEHRRTRPIMRRLRDRRPSRSC